MKSLTTAVLALGTMFAAVTPAQAETVIVESQEVDLSKYNLSSQSGAMAALRDITQAANKVCGADRTMPGRYNEVISSRECVRTAIGAAVSESGSAVLAKVHNVKTLG
ncbi:MAG: UrcA family protein [Henriciella sp.]|jgi:UrcA family protein